MASPSEQGDRIDPPSGAGEISGFRRNLPNALTGMRVVLAGGFIVLMSLPNYNTPYEDNRLLMGIGLAVFVIAAVTDALDGYLARKWNVVSVFGRIMDPFADKVLVLGAFVMLAGPQFSILVPGESYERSADLSADLRTMFDQIGTLQLTGIESWMVVVILARDLLITTLRGMVEGQGKSFAALKAGKLKMIVQSIGVPMILLMLTITTRPNEGAARWIILISAWTVTVVTIWSAIPYYFDARRKLASP